MGSCGGRQALCCRIVASYACLVPPPPLACPPRRCVALPATALQAPVEGLLPEEDAQVPGGYREAMSSKTPLGKAVSGACEELDTLGSLVGAA